MHRRTPLISISSAILAAAVVTGCTMGSPGPARQPNSGSTGGGVTNNDLTVMTNTGILSGLTAKSFDPKNTISSWYGVYHDLWEKQFPDMKIHEIQVKDDDAEVTKTLLSVNAGNPPDLIGVHQQLPQLVQRGAVENLDKYYNAAGIKPSDFLGPLADYVRYDGHWYGLPGASNPSFNLFYIPARLKAAGFDPRNVPKTFDELYAASQKAVKFAPNGDLERVGYPVDTGLNRIDLYCGKPTTYDPATNKFQPTASCVEGYFAYNKKLLDLYGGQQKYTKFMAGDPSYWSCSAKAYLPSGKVLFWPDGYWAGPQLDNCYDVAWALTDPPTQHGTQAELAGQISPAWVMAVPRGAKNPQLAFDFVRFTVWEHGERLGPTTNGYVSQKLAEPWSSYLIKHQAKLRAKNKYPGNPMAEAAPIVAKDAALAGTSYPKNPNTAYFNTQMANAWSQVAFGKKTPAEALGDVQKLIDAKNQQR